MFSCYLGIWKLPETMNIHSLALSSFSYVVIRVTSLEQLSVAEFSGEYTSSKVYENGHKNVLAIWLDLLSNVKIWAHF